ncbi:MAG: type III-A CRISPR-associated RAMP protein Csm5 [Methanocorpusculum sp.]|nr:type III-A CRISPR-associated RAMP protein Csm5 [Methanocorpusculum sp.]
MSDSRYEAVTLRTYSPLHIGTGNVYGSSEILMQGGKYFRLKGEELFRYVCEQNREEEFFQEMMSGDVRLDKYVRGMVPASLRRYDLVRHDPERSVPLRDVRECVKTMDVPYVPGSSLKGAIRTAVLWKAVCEDPTFAESMRESSQPRSRRQWFGKEYFSSLLCTGRKKSDAKYDLLKFVEVSDMMPVLGQSDLLSLAGVVTYSQHSGGMLVPKQYQVLAECVPSKVEFSGSIGISPQLSVALRNPGEYPRLEGMLGLLGLSEDPEDRKAMVRYLKSVCSEFASAALEQELELCSQSPELCVSLKNCQTALNLKKNLMRLGFSVGTGYQTVMSELIRQDADLAAALISEMKLGKYPRSVVGDGLDMPYPKSVELTTKNKPLGWILW